MPKLDCIIETALYVDDVARARAFYAGVMQLDDVMLDSDDLVAFNVGGRSALLIFKRGRSTSTRVLPGGPGQPKGELPPHDGSGPLHTCFAISADELGPWERRLADHGVEIDGRVHWPRGGTSIYFTDPDGHLLELMTPGNWPIY